MLQRNKGNISVTEEGGQRVKMVQKDWLGVSHVRRGAEHFKQAFSDHHCSVCKALNSFPNTKKNLS